MTTGNSQANNACDSSPWAPIIFEAFSRADVRQVSYVPDAGHARLIEMCASTQDMKTTVLTTEEEGIALAAGAWLGGERSALLMQSSGVGNCVNMFSLLATCRIPLVMVVTMRGEFHEFNPWQVPMGRATQQALEIMGVQVVRIDDLDELEEMMASATTMAFDGDGAVAVLLSQRLLGAKKWVK